MTVCNLVATNILEEQIGSMFRVVSCFVYEACMTISNLWHPCSNVDGAAVWLAWYTEWQILCRTVQSTGGVASQKNITIQLQMMDWMVSLSERDRRAVFQFLKVEWCQPTETHRWKCAMCGALCVLKASVVGRFHILNGWALNDGRTRTGTVSHGWQSRGHCVIKSPVHDNRCWTVYSLSAAKNMRIRTVHAVLWDLGHHKMSSQWASW